MTKRRPAGLVAATILAESGGLADTAAGWRSYREYLGVLAEENARRRDERFGRMSRGWVVGSAQFKAGLNEEPGEKGTGKERFELLGADRAALREARAAGWEEKLDRAAAALGVVLDDLPVQKSAPAKVLLAAVMKTGTSVANGWLDSRSG